MPITKIFEFDQAVIGTQGYCFRLSVKWVALMVAGQDPAGATNACRNFFSREGTNRSAGPRTWEKTKQKQASYQSRSEDLADEETLADVEKKLVRTWVNAALARNSTSAVTEVQVTLHDFDDSDAEDPLAEWAVSMTRKAWRGAVLSSAGGHSIALFNAGDHLLGFEPNYGMFKITHASLGAAAKALIAESNKMFGSDLDARNEFTTSFVNVVN